MKAVMITGAEWSVSDKQSAKIKELNTELIHVHSKEDAVREVKDAEILLCFDSTYSDIIFDANPNLKWINCLSAGVNDVLTDKVKDFNVLLTNSKGVHSIPITEHVIASMIGFARNFPRMVHKQDEHVWDRKVPVDEIYGKRAVVVGLGAIGKSIAKAACNMGCVVIGVKRTPEEIECVTKVYGIKDLDQALIGADYVISVVPQTKETLLMFKTPQFEAMKGAYFINVGRGNLVDEQDLISALKNNVIKGAALDVFEREPLPSTSPLWDMENVFITPHVAGHNPHYMERAMDIFVKNLEAYKNGQLMQNVVNKVQGY